MCSNSFSLAAAQPGKQDLLCAKFHLAPGTKLSLACRAAQQERNTMSVFAGTQIPLAKLQHMYHTSARLNRTTNSLLPLLRSALVLIQIAHPAPASKLLYRNLLAARLFTGWQAVLPGLLKLPAFYTVLPRTNSAAMKFYC